MALPLIALAGAGILSGGRYLMNKADQRNAQQNTQGLEAFLSQSTLAQQRPDIAQGLLAEANSTTQGGGSIFGNFNAGGQTQSLIDSARNLDAQMVGGQIARQAELQDAYSQSNTAIFDSIESDYRRDFQQFAEVQKQFQSAMLALENPSNLNSVTTLYNLFNILEPGGRVTQNEDGTLSGAGSLSNRAANWLREWQGEGLTDATRKEITEAIWAQYTPKLDAARRRKAVYEADLDRAAKEGRNIRNPFRQGINFGVNQLPPQLPPERGGQSPELAIPAGFSRVVD